MRRRWASGARPKRHCAGQSVTTTTPRSSDTCRSERVDVGDSIVPGDEVPREVDALEAVERRDPVLGDIDGVQGRQRSQRGQFREGIARDVDVDQVVEHTGQRGQARELVSGDAEPVQRGERRQRLDVAELVVVQVESLQTGEMADTREMGEGVAVETERDQ